MKIILKSSRAKLFCWLLMLFSMGSLAMEVSRTYPKNGAIGVSVNQTLMLTFDKAINARKINEAIVQVEGPEEFAANFQFIVRGKRLLVKFDQDFHQSQELSLTASKYTVSIDNVLSKFGERSEPFVFSFYVESPKFPAFQIENRRYQGFCLTVENRANRASKASEFQPVVELQACNEVDIESKQLWFLSKAGQEDQAQKIHWVEDFNYCLVEDEKQGPVLTPCAQQAGNQYFNFTAITDDFKVRNRDSDRCLASANFDRGKINRVTMTPCHFPLARNRWFVKRIGLRDLSQPFWLGATDLRYAKIAYKNPKYAVDLNAESTRDLVKRLYLTEAQNQEAIAQALNLEAGSNTGDGFSLNNPYYPRPENSNIPLPKARSVIIDGVEVFNPEGYANTNEGYDIDGSGRVRYYQQEAATSWWSDYTRGLAEFQSVCAVKFEDSEKVKYNLRTFSSALQAKLSGWRVTHVGKCGVCSTLKDLAVYMGVPDQTTPTRLCTKRGRGQVGRLAEVKQCLIDAVGFSDLCAESWAYNGLHSSAECRGTCLRTYGNDGKFPWLEGLINVVIAEKFDACPPKVASNDPDLRAFLKEQGCPLENEQTGKLNACIYCDERVSGPGFKYSAGRTRRNSGLESAIPRFYDAIRYEANHTAYFD